MNFNPSVASLEKYATNQVPTNLGGGTNQTEVYVGDFTKLMIGMRTEIQLEISRVAADATNGAFANGQVWVRAYLRADVQIAKPKHFEYISGIIPVA